MALLAMLFLAAVPLAEHCDRYLPVSRGDHFGYRMRGDRCEGVYIQQVSATPLLVASFGRLELPEAVPAAGSLLVQWAGPPRRGEVRLRAQSLKPRTYYRMDHRQPADSRSYQWPTDVLAALKLKPREIGMVALAESHVAGVPHVYLPVRIGAAPPGQERTYELLVVPGQELSEVYVALSSVAPDGKRSEVAPAKPLRYGFYPAGRSIRIPVGPIARPGTYLLDIGATLRDGGAVSQEVWFVEAAPDAR